MSDQALNDRTDQSCAEALEWLIGIIRENGHTVDDAKRFYLGLGVEAGYKAGFEDGMRDAKQLIAKYFGIRVE
jgi:hypothetical protein